GPPLRAAAPDLLCESRDALPSSFPPRCRRYLAALRLTNHVICRFKQVAEQGAVMDHCLTQILRSRSSFRMMQGDFARSAVVHYDIRVINRDIFASLLEVAHWVTTSGHDLSNQPIGFCHSTTRVVDERALDGPPGALKPSGRGSV